MTTIWRASAESRHYEFEGYGATEQAARDALNDAFRIHAEQCGLDTDWHQNAVDVSAREIVLGQPYRDGDIIRSRR